MKRLVYFLACLVSVLVSASVAFGQDAVSLSLNSPLVAPARPGGAAAVPLPGSYSSPVFEGVVTLRIWDSLPVSDPGWAMATTGRPGLFLNPTFPTIPPGILPPWLDIGTKSFVIMPVQEVTRLRGGVPFPPIPPLPGESSFGVAVVPEPGTWVRSELAP